MVGVFFLRDLPDELQFDMNLRRKSGRVSGSPNTDPALASATGFYEENGLLEGNCRCREWSGRPRRITRPQKTPLHANSPRKETDGRITLELESPDFGSTWECPTRRFKSCPIQSKIGWYSCGPSRLVRLQGGRTGRNQFYRFLAVRMRPIELKR